MTAELLATMDRVTDARRLPGRPLESPMRCAPSRRTSARSRRTSCSPTRTIRRRPDKALAGAPPRQDMPVWSDDGRTLYFRGADAKGVAQLWRVGTDGVAPVQLTRAPLDVGSFQVAPDGSFAVAAFRVYPDCPTLECNRRARGEAAGRDTLHQAQRPLLRQLRRRAVQWPVQAWLRRSAAGAADAGHGDRFAPPGRSAPRAPSPFRPTAAPWSFSARPSGASPNVSTVHRLYEVSLGARSAPREIAPELPGSHMNPAFSPTAGCSPIPRPRSPESDGDRKSVRVRTLATGQVRELGAALDRWPNEITWSLDSRTIYARSDDDGARAALCLSSVGQGRAAAGRRRLRPRRLEARARLDRQRLRALPPQVFAAAADGRAPAAGDPGCRRADRRRRAGADAVLHLQGLERRAGPGLRHRAAEPRAGQALSGAVPDPRRPARRLPGRMGLWPQSRRSGRRAAMPR